MEKTPENGLKKSFGQDAKPQAESPQNPPASNPYLGLMGWPHNIPKGHI